MNNLFILLILFLSFLPGCATAPEAIPLTQGLNLKDFCASNDIHCRWDNLTTTIHLKKGDFEASALIGSPLVLINGEKVSLSENISLQKSTILVPLDFKNLVVQRLITKPVVKQRKFKAAQEIILDAGHGGKDPGALGKTGTQEKDIVLDITRRVKWILERKGIKVRMTRAKDEFISLMERTEIASRYPRADLFVSIHANASPVRSVSGLEVFSANDLDHLEKQEEQRMKNHKIFFKHLAVKEGDPKIQAIIADMLYTHKQAESPQVSRFVGQKTARLADIDNYNNKYARFFVLRNTLIPAILVEVGFLSNPKEERLLKTSSYRQKIAHALAKSITDYFKYNEEP